MSLIEQFLSGIKRGYALGAAGCVSGGVTRVILDRRVDGLSVRVDLYVPWGQYRVVVERLDVHYTLGEAARRREEIVRRLTAAGRVPGPAGGIRLNAGEPQ